MAKKPYAEFTSDSDIVEIELTTLPSKRLFGVVRAIYRHTGAWGDCQPKHLSASKAYMSSPVDSPVGMWLTCDNLQKEAWHAIAVRGAPPPSGRDEGAAANIHGGHKSPAAQAEQPPSP